MDLVFPPRCVGCGRPGPLWCAACEGALHLIAAPVCAACGRSLGGGQQICGRCSAEPPSVVARSYARYKGPLVHALLQLKYRRDPRIAELFAGWLGEILQREGWTIDRVTAVPLGAGRLRMRGYNQAALIGRGLSRALRIPFEEGLLTRVRETPSQVGLDHARRRRNVAGAFAADPELVRGKRVLVVDDLYTTGSTLSSCGEALLAAGAEAVFALTVGRA